MIYYNDCNYFLIILLVFYSFFNHFSLLLQILLKLHVVRKISFFYSSFFSFQKGKNHDHD